MFRREQRILVTFILASFALLAIALPFSARAVGITPGDIFIENIGQNNVVDTSVYFTRTNASTTDRVRVVVEGTAAPYILFPLGPEIDLPINQPSTEFPLQINSGSLASGTYTATITVGLISQGSGVENPGGFFSAGSSVTAGAKGTLTFTVTNESIESFSIQSVSMGDAEQGQLIGFSFLFNNTGNVDTRPSKVEFGVVDELDPSNVYSETIPAEAIPIVPAFSQQTINLVTQANLTPGLYQTLITFYDQTGSVIYVADNIRLQVFPQGTLAQKGQLISFVTDKAEYAQAELVKFTSSFENIGEVGVKAESVIEIFQGDKRIEVLKKEGEFIPAGTAVELDYTYTPPTGGEYSAIGYVAYGIFKTEELEAKFSVQALKTVYVIGFLVTLTLVAGLIVFWIHRRKQKKRTQASPVNQHQPKASSITTRKTTKKIPTSYQKNKTRQKKKARKKI